MNRWQVLTFPTGLTPGQRRQGRQETLNPLFSTAGISRQPQLLALVLTVTELIAGVKLRFLQSNSLLADFRHGWVRSYGSGIGQHQCARVTSF